MENYTVQQIEIRTADKTHIMKSATCPGSVDEDPVEAELTELGGSDHQSDNVEGLEIYIFICLTVQR